MQVEVEVGMSGLHVSGPRVRKGRCVCVRTYVRVHACMSVYVCAHVSVSVGTWGLHINTSTDTLMTDAHELVRGERCSGRVTEFRKLEVDEGHVTEVCQGEGTGGWGSCVRIHYTHVGIGHASLSAGREIDGGAEAVLPQIAA